MFSQTLRAIPWKTMALCLELGLPEDVGHEIRSWLCLMNQHSQAKIIKKIAKTYQLLYLDVVSLGFSVRSYSQVPQDHKRKYAMKLPDYYWIHISVILDESAGPSAYSGQLDVDLTDCHLESLKTLKLLLPAYSDNKKIIYPGSLIFKAQNDLALAK